MKVKITIADKIIEAVCRRTATAFAILDNLPFESQAQTWGDEIYFSTPANADLEADAKEVVEAGEIAFWVEGRCIAIGYGPTPISQGDEIRLAAKTNIWADAIDDVKILSGVSTGAPVKIEKC